MKQLVISIMVLFGVQYMLAQETIRYYDITPDVGQNNFVPENRDQWETIFNIPFPSGSNGSNYTSTAAESDGDHLYVTGWKADFIRKYTMQGVMVDSFQMIGADSLLRDLAYDGQHYYGAIPTLPGKILVLDFSNQICVDTILLPFASRSLAYNDDDSLFYSNNWSTDIMVFNHDGVIVDTLPVDGVFGSYYGFAYDNWTEGGPYLWGFSQQGEYNATLVQLSLPSGQETGFYMDLGYLGTGTLAGGLFTYPDYDSNRAVIGGVMQNQFMFGLELAPIPPPPLAFEVGGSVSTGSTSLDGGTIDLYKMEDNMVLEKLTSEIDQSGNYLFPEVYEGEYLLHARAGSTSAFFESHAPTYLEGNMHWEDETPSLFTSNSYNNDIELAEMADMNSGIGQVSGQVFDLSDPTGDPVQEAQVMLLTMDDECFAFTYTDEEGMFSFSDIGLDSYSLLVEMAGKLMEPYPFTLSETEPGLTGLILYVTEGSIMVGTEEELTANVRHVGNFYPNPSNNQSKLEIVLDEASILQLKVFNTSTQLIHNQTLELSEGNHTVGLEMGNSIPGLYYVLIRFDDKYSVTRKLLKTQ